MFCTGFCSSTGLPVASGNWVATLSIFGGAFFYTPLQLGPQQVLWKERKVKYPKGKNTVCQKENIIFCVQCSDAMNNKHICYLSHYLNTKSISPIFRACQKTNKYSGDLLDFKYFLCWSEQHRTSFV